MEEDPQHHSANPPPLEEDFEVVTPRADQLAEVSRVVTKAVGLQLTIDGLEDMLKVHKQELHDLTTRILPDTMAAAGTTMFKTSEGVKVEIRDFLNGSLPKDTEKREEALNWLDNHGAKDLIKVQYSLAFGRGQTAEALAVRERLVELGAAFSEREDVHAQTLYAFARERMRAGESLPLELLGLYAGRVAKIELPSG